MAGTRCLSLHAEYRCRHAGACCSAGWPIPVEADRLTRLRGAIAAGTLRPAASHPGDAFVLTHDATQLALDGTRCVFHDAAAHRCRIHRALGHDALPLACRQFPRVCVRDPRGVSVTLSHYCPTAASLLATGDAVTIVTDAAAFPSAGEYDGLDATTSLPPLLRPNMAMDWESWWECERLTVNLLANSDEQPAILLARVGRAVEDVRAWQLADGSLLARVQSAFDRAKRADVGAVKWDAAELEIRNQEILRAVPDDWKQAVPAAAGQRTTDGVTRRLLAAHAFANWTAHLGTGLRTWFRSVEAPLALLENGADVRTADLLLRHFADPHSLAAAMGHVDPTTR